MKSIKLTFIITIHLLSFAFAQEGWFWQNPLPQGNPLVSVSFIDSETGWAIGNLGTILKTTNGGENWINQTSGTTQYLIGVSFTDANNGTAVGSGGTILRTTDGGDNWVSQSSGTTTWLWGVSC